MSPEFPSEAIAHQVIDTANHFRGWLESQGDPEISYVGVATLISDLAVTLAKTTTPMRAADMLLCQLDILFEEFPGLQRELMAAQLKRHMMGKKQ